MRGSREVLLDEWLASWGVVGTWGGWCPIQGEWNLPGGLWAYFRARGESWELSVWAHPPREDDRAGLPPDEAELWCYRERVPGANLGLINGNEASKYVWRGFCEYLRSTGARDVCNLNLTSDCPPWQIKQH